MDARFWPIILAAAAFFVGIPVVPIASGAESRIVPAIVRYEDGRPSALYRLEAHDEGVVLRHGDGPNRSDIYGARDVWAFNHGGTFFLHYDAAGPDGWLTSLATSKDLKTFTKRGPVLALGPPGAPDSATASYGTTYFDGKTWHMFYLGTQHATPSPDKIPALPYITLKAKAADPSGPWTKQPGIVPFTIKPGTYYNNTASPGFIVKSGDEYLQFFRAAMPRTIGIARTRDLEGPWTMDDTPALPASEQIENSSLYFQKSTQTWFMFTNHVAIKKQAEFTDAIWVYWTQNLEHWDPNNKAVVLDGSNSSWSKTVIGLPSVLPVNGRLAIFYDGLEPTAERPDPISHMNRDIGLAWLDLPIKLPDPGVKLLAQTDPAPKAVGLVRGSPLGERANEPLRDGTCHLDLTNGSPRSDAPVKVSHLLRVQGWAVASISSGIAADQVFLTVTSASGEIYTLTAEKYERPDVKAHFKRPEMQAPGFDAEAAVGSLAKGLYRLELFQTYRGIAYPCGINQQIIVD